MKLRIRENSIRLRLRQPEVACVVGAGLIESTSDFGTASLRIALVGKNVAQLSASFADNSIVVTAPLAMLSEWANSNDVGLYGEQPASTGEVFTIAVEKDFRCLDRSHADDDQAGTYPHPALKSSPL